MVKIGQKMASVEPVKNFGGQGHYWNGRDATVHLSEPLLKNYKTVFSWVTKIKQQNDQIDINIHNPKPVPLSQKGELMRSK